MVSTALTKWTHTDAGQPTWEESQRFLPVQVPVRIHFIIVMIRWTGLAPWEFAFGQPTWEES